MVLICEVLNAKRFTAGNLCSFVKATGLSDLHVNANRP